MSQPAPTAKGSLAATPFGHLLIYALDHRLTGTIVLEEPSHAKHALYMVDGAPAKARVASQASLLGELVLERRALHATDLNEALSEARDSHRRLGEVLIDRGALDPETLEVLLRDQVARRVQDLAGLPAETVYGYYEGTNFLERAGGPAGYTSPLSLIWRVIRRGVEPTRMRDLFARLGDAELRFHLEAPLGRFEFDPREQAVVDVLRAKPQPLDELLGRGLADPFIVELLVYALSALRHFDMGTGARPVGADRSSGSLRAVHAPQAAASPSPPPPVAAPPPAAARAMPMPSPSPPPATAYADPVRREIAERLGGSKDSYYQVLGVPEDAPVDAIATAFFQLAKRFHPDRLGPGYEDVRELATRLFARMTEAHQVLSDPARRQEYDELLKHGEGAAEEQEEVLRVVRAATSFQKAQVLLKRNSLAAAEAEARQALADDPEQADHIALVAWLDSLKPGADLEGALKALNRAVKMEEANLRVLWYRGQILKRLGQERRALEDFRTIAERDPRHVDAQRELRLHDMRRGGPQPKTDPAHERASDPTKPRRSSTPPASADKAGFFGKLFKR